jgi:hypothetical protein
MDGLPEVALTSRGTRPGDPVGDILFNLLMVIIMKDITNTMCASSQATWLGSGAPISDLLLTEALKPWPIMLSAKWPLSMT